MTSSLSHSREHDISGMPGGIFKKYLGGGAFMPLIKRVAEDMTGREE